MRESTEKMIYKVSGLTKKYQGESQNIVLDNLSFSLAQSSFIAIVGPSGVGKSTLLNLLGLLDTPDAGNINFLDTEVAELSKEERSRMRRREIGFIFQAHHLFAELTVLENVMVPLLLTGSRKEEVKSLATEILADLEILDKKHTRPNNLSGGERQRVAIGRAIIHRPAVVLGDEISGNLDIKTSQKVLQILMKLSQKYATSLVIATHDMMIAKKADTILRLEEGGLQSL